MTRYTRKVSIYGALIRICDGDLNAAAVLQGLLGGTEDRFVGKKHRKAALNYLRDRGLITDDGVDFAALSSALVEVYLNASDEPDKEDDFVYVYLIQQDGTGLYKIGMTKRPMRRLMQLQLESDRFLSIVHMRKFHIVDGQKRNRFEKIMHDAFDEYRVRGEWFAFPDDVVADAVALMDTLADMAARRREQ